MNILGVTSQTWFPIVTLIVGALLKATFDRFSDHRVAQREREARREQRLAAIRLRREAFQRATLLELQEAISQLVRFTGKSNHLDVMAFRKSGKWQKQYLPADLDEDALKARVNVSRLRVRVRDERIRKLVESLSTKCVNVVLSTSEKEAENSLLEMASVLDELDERIGTVLRNLDEDEDRLLE